MATSSVHPINNYSQWETVLKRSAEEEKKSAEVKYLLGYLAGVIALVASIVFKNVIVLINGLMMLYGAHTYVEMDKQVPTQSQMLLNYLTTEMRTVGSEKRFVKLIKLASGSQNPQVSLSTMQKAFKVYQQMEKKPHQREQLWPKFVKALDLQPVEITNGISQVLVEIRTLNAGR